MLTHKKNIFAIVACSIALLIASALPAANGAEIEKPKLVSFKFTPTTVDEKYSPTNVDFTVVVSSPTGVFNEKIWVNVTNYSNISLGGYLYRSDKPINKSLSTVTFIGTVIVPPSLPAGPLFAYVDEVYSIWPATGRQGWPSQTFYPGNFSKLVGAENALLIRTTGELNYAYSTFIGPSYSDSNLELPWSDSKYTDYDYPVFRIGETIDISEYYELKVTNVELKVTTSSPGVCTASGKIIKFEALGECNFKVFTDKTKDYQALTNFQTANISSARDKFSLKINPIPEQNTKLLPKVLTGPLVYDYDGFKIIYPTTKTPSICHPTSTNINLISGGLCILSYTSVANDYHLGSVKNIEFNITKQSQEIAATLTSSAIKKGKKTSLTAAATSGLEIISKSKSPEICTVEKLNIVALKKGLCAIELSQAGNGVFNSVQKNLTLKIL